MPQPLNRHSSPRQSEDRRIQSPFSWLTSPLWHGLVFSHWGTFESLMPALSYILIALGIYLLACAGYDEFRGSATKPLTLMGRRHNTAYLYSLRILRTNIPELFRGFMVTHWIYASLVVVAGCVPDQSYKKRDDF